LRAKKNNTDSVKGMSEMYTSFQINKDRMNEVVAELEIVKKTNYDIQKQFNEQSLAYAKEVEVSQIGKKHKELSTKYYELKRNTIY
jgi:predicted nuclease with TOPRIM domain